MGNKQHYHHKEHFKTLNVEIRGMHCPNCEVLIERKFKNVPGVRWVHVSNRKGSAEIRYSGDLDVGTLQSAVEEDGYIVSVRPEQSSVSAEEVGENSQRHYVEIGQVFLILVAFYFLLKQFDLVPDRLAIPNTISYGLAFVIGVVASLSTCIAVTGGLLVAAAAKYNAASGGLTGVQRFKPHIYFNAGRIISYTVLGGAIGALGSTFALSPEANGILVILASVIMIALGLQMLKLMPSLGVLQLTMPKFIAHKIHNFSEKEAKGGAFILGASTFFLPCGFTQALQLYVLAKGDAQTGALVMLAFALGPLPALLSRSAL
jgi:sulfite exporter TauE/SafE/copper chaperone CopZ